MKKVRTLFGVLGSILLLASLCSAAVANNHATRASVAGFDYSTAPDNAGVFDVKEFGAKGDGKALDTAAINRAIDAAAAAGGGTVQFPAGTYRCFSVHLKSNVALYLGPGHARIDES